MTQPSATLTLPRRISGESMLGPEQAYLWLCIPKNASRSITAMLSRAGAARLMDLHPDVPAADLDRLELRPRFTFAFVRNPYDRILSVWRIKIAPPAPIENTRALYDRHPGLHAGMGFDAFVAWLGEGYPRGQINKHWAAQADFVTHDGRLLPDFIGRLERFDADMERLASVIGPVGEVQRKNVSADPAAATEPAISARAREIICTIYRQDFEVLGYDTDPGARRA